VPSAKQAPHDDELADVVSVVIGEEQRFAKNRLAGAVRDFGE
jgi:hypothetical protein